VARRGLRGEEGGWSPGAEASVDMYFHTRPHQRLAVLGSLLQELVRCGELPQGTPEAEPEASVLGRAMQLVLSRPWARATSGRTGGGDARSRGPLNRLG
jgi:hypothetical protein